MTGKNPTKSLSFGLLQTLDIFDLLVPSFLHCILLHTHCSLHSPQCPWVCLFSGTVEARANDKANSCRQMTQHDDGAQMICASQGGLRGWGWDRKVNLVVGQYASQKMDLDRKTVHKLKTHFTPTYVSVERKAPQRELLATLGNSNNKS